VSVGTGLYRLGRVEGLGPIPAMTASFALLFGSSFFGLRFSDLGFRFFSFDFRVSNL